MNIESKGKLRLAVSCSSNMNRSMEAHYFLKARGFNVQSFGSGNAVKLPGPAANQPNVYEFGAATYDDIYNDLKNKDPQLYTQNGLLHMLDRNRRLKERPEKFQLSKQHFDVIICLEERVYDQVADELLMPSRQGLHISAQVQILEDLQTRTPETGESVHVINLDIEDNHEEATIGALFVVELCKKLEDCEDLDNEIDEVLADFEAKHPDRNILHTICFY